MLDVDEDLTQLIKIVLYFTIFQSEKQIPNFLMTCSSLFRDQTRENKVQCVQKLHLPTEALVFS